MICNLFPSSRTRSERGRVLDKIPGRQQQLHQSRRFQQEFCHSGSGRSTGVTLVVVVCFPSLFSEKSSSTVQQSAATQNTFPMLSISTIVPSHQFKLIEQQLLHCISIWGSIRSQMSFGPAERLLRCSLGIYSEGSPSIWLGCFIKYFLKCLKYFQRYLQYFQGETALLVGWNLLWRKPRTGIWKRLPAKSSTNHRKWVNSSRSLARSGILYQSTKFKKKIIVTTDKITK